MAQALEVVGDTTPPVWAALRNQAEHVAREEPSLASLLNAVILRHGNLADALSYQLARKLGDQELRAMSLREVAEEAYAGDPSIIGKAEADLRAVFERDPACKSYLQPFLYFKGFLALQTHRVSHYLWSIGRESIAFYLQSRVSEQFQVDVHPAVSIGKGAFFDHGTGIVIGETTVIGDDVSMLQNVTLGGTGAERGDRHPKIGNGVLLAPAPRCWATSRSATTPRSRQVPWSSSPCRRTAPPLAFPPAWSTARHAPSRPRAWITPSPRTSTTTSFEAEVGGAARIL